MSLRINELTSDLFCANGIISPGLEHVISGSVHNASWEQSCEGSEDGQGIVDTSASLDWENGRNKVSNMAAL